MVGPGLRTRVAFETPPMPLRITGGQESFVRRIYLPGDLVTINAGTVNGIEVGQEFFVRRLQVSRREAVTRSTPGSIRTAGWIKVWAVDDEMSLATVTHACDTIEEHDYLDRSFFRRWSRRVDARQTGTRQLRPRVVGADLRRVFGKEIPHRESRQPGWHHAGSQFVFYRDKKQVENFLYNLGEAVAVDVATETSTLRVTGSRDSIHEGDYVAMRKSRGARLAHAPFAGDVTSVTRAVSSSGSGGNSRSPTPLPQASPPRAPRIPPARARAPGPAENQ